MIPVITSSANPKIKWVRGLHKNSQRRKEGVFLVEGAKEVELAIAGGFEPKTMFVCPEIYGDIAAQLGTSGIFSVTKDVYEKITYRGSSDGILVVFEEKKLTLDQLKLSENPFVVIVESVEKPGNLGAIIRTADGAGVDAVIVCDERTDIFNPNVIRSSVGTLFSKQVVAAENSEVLDLLQKYEIKAYGAILDVSSAPYHSQDYTSPTAIVLGTEHEGLSQFWKHNSNPIVIPMNGSNDSLNVSTAGAILAYEVVRQRHAN